MAVDVLIPNPLLQMRNVVSDLNAFGPMAHFFPEQQIVKGARTDVIKHLINKITRNGNRLVMATVKTKKKKISNQYLTECLGHQWRVHSVQLQYLVEDGKFPQ